MRFHGALGNLSKPCSRRFLAVISDDLNDNKILQTELSFFF